MSTRRDGTYLLLVFLLACTGGGGELTPNGPLPVGSRDQALTGDFITSVALPTGSQCSGIATSLALLPSAIFAPHLDSPFLLATSCSNEQIIHLTDPNIGGSPQHVFDITVTPAGIAPEGFGSMALRADRGDLIACRNGTTGHKVYKINLQTGAATFLLDVAGPQVGAFFCDGVAWDGLTDTIYMSPDVSDTVYEYQVDQLDALIGTTSWTVPAGCMQSVSQGANSGISVSGDSVYLGCNGLNRAFKVDKITHVVDPALPSGFDSGDNRTEDLECDPLTFPNTDVLWTKEAFENTVHAFEVTRGSCNLGGAEPPVEPAPPDPACCAVADQGDSDGDGLLDCWEKNGGIYFDNNCTIDFPLSGVDFLKADLFVEMDYMLSISSPAALSTIRANLVTAFANSEYENPGGSPGITLHMEIGEEIPLVSSTVWEGCSTPGTSASFDTLKDTWFGADNIQRANTLALNSKKLIYHYGIMVNGLEGFTTTRMGCAEVPGNDFIIAKQGFQGGWTTGGNQDGVIMHEIGHNLGLRHGGDRNLNNQPNYVSTMNDALATVTFNTGRTLRFSTLKAPWTETTINENSGIAQGSPCVARETAWYNGTMGQADQTCSSTDFNGGGLSTSVTVDVTNDGITSVELPGFADKDGIVLNFREVVDYAAASHLSLLTNEEVSSTIYTDNFVDDDGDGVHNFGDNCSFIPNPDQADSNGNFIGNACEVKPVFVCVSHKAGETIAHFGYINLDREITVPLGPDNAFGGGATIVGGFQPTVFPRGAVADVVQVAFDNQGTATWTLSGTTVSADQQGRHCNAPADVPRGPKP